MFIFSFCVLQAKREGAEAGGLRAGGSRNAVYGDRVRQKKTNQNTLKSILIRTAQVRKTGAIKRAFKVFVRKFQVTRTCKFSSNP